MVHIKMCQPKEKLVHNSAVVHENKYVLASVKTVVREPATKNPGQTKNVGHPIVNAEKLKIVLQIPNLEGTSDKQSSNKMSLNEKQ